MMDPFNPRGRMPSWHGDEGPTSVDIADAASVAGFDWLVLDSRGAGDTGAARLLSGMALRLSRDPTHLSSNCVGSLSLSLSLSWCHIGDVHVLRDSLDLLDLNLDHLFDLLSCLLDFRNHRTGGTGDGQRRKLVALALHAPALPQ